jgi:hypothetical protein
MPKKTYPVELYPLTPRAEKIIDYFDNKLLLVETDDYGIPMTIAPDGRQGIFCMSRDGFWNGWFILDEDVKFLQEQKTIETILSAIKNDKNPK